MGKMQTAALGRHALDSTCRHRRSRVELTDAGSRLLSYARAIDAGFAAAERDVAGTASVQTLRLGVLATTPRRWIEAFLADQRSFPCGDRIEMFEGRERDLRSRLARGRIDAALTILRNDDEREAGRHIVTEGYSLALGAAHPPVGGDIVGVEDLVNEPMIVRRHRELLPDTSRFFTARGIRPFFPARTTSADCALAYVRAGLGITVMSDGFRETGVVRAPLRDFEFTRHVGLVFAPHVDHRALADGPLMTPLVDAIVTTTG